MHEITVSHCLSTVYLFHNIVLANGCWVISWLEEQIAVAFFLLLITTICLIISLIGSCKDVLVSGEFFEQNGLKLEVWFIRIAVQNGKLKNYFISLLFWALLLCLDFCDID